MPNQNPRNAFPAWRLRYGLRKASSDELDQSIESCESWGWYCAAILAGGVLLEFVLAALHPPYDSFCERWGSSVANALVFLGVAGEVQFGRMASRRQAELKRRTDEDLAEANRELARVKAQIAPRSMTVEQQQSVASRLKGFKGHRAYIAVNPNLPESQVFARVIAATLQMAELDVVFPAMANRMPLWPGGVIAGFTSDPGSRTAALAIAEAFFDAGVIMVPSPGEPSTGNPNPSFVLLTVGTKPDADAAEAAKIAIPQTIAAMRRSG